MCKSHLFLILLLGAGLRFHALARDMRFQPDEALFSTFARAAAINGDWLLPGALDKPPLAIYANALSVVLVGESEFAARLPGMLASIVLLAVIYRLTCDLYHSTRIATAALLLMALSPYAIAFSATTLTDGLMLVLVMLALSLAVREHWGWSGLWLGLAFASKQQAIFYLPLLGIVGWAVHQHTGKSLLRLGVIFGTCLALLAVWDRARGGVSIFTLATLNNDPSRLIRANEILPRLAIWVNHTQALIGVDWLTSILIGLALVSLMVRVVQQARRREVLVDLMLFAWLVGYFLLHWLVAFNTYDRYLLLVLPAVIVLVARGLEWTRYKIGRSTAPLLQIIIVCILLMGAVNASEGRTPINQAGAQYVGIDVLADYLNSKPVATVIYDRWLGWELGYYMGQWTDKRRVYYPTPLALAQGALSLCEIGTRYLPAPTDQPIDPYLDALREAGFKVVLDSAMSGFVVYAITPAWADASAVAASSPGQSGLCGGE